MDRLVGKRATVVSASGQKYRGEISQISQEKVILWTAYNRSYWLWRANEVQSVQVGDEVYVYKPDKGILELGDGPVATTQTIVVTGVGRTGQEALRDALQNAVRQVVGEVVDAETLVKDDELIHDTVLLYSHGLVKGHKELDQWERDGLIYKTIRAEVERKQLSDTLKAKNIKVRDFDGQQLYDQVVTELQRQKDGRRLVQATFKNYPSSVLEATVVAEPHVADKSEDRVTLAYTLVLDIDLDKYRAFLERALPVLDLMASRKGTVTLRAVTVPRVDDKFYEAFLPAEARPALGPSARRPGVLQFDLRYHRETWWTDMFDPKTDFPVLINTARNSENRLTAWTWYHVPLTELPSNSLRVSVRFLDGAGQDVRQEGFSLGPALPGFRSDRRPFLHPKTREKGEATQVIISPYFLVGAQYAPRLTLERTIELPLEDLPRVKKLSCSVTAIPMADGDQAAPTGAASSPPP
jgi:hypothetical protein